MLREILTYPDPLLKRRAAPVSEITPEIRTLAADIAETMYASEGIGLAAPQVGEALRLVVADVSGPEARENLLVLVNPELELCGEEIESEEGCLSVEDYRAPVRRSSRVKVKALDLEGRPLAFEAEDLLAVCLQHECDHLDGKLFIDRISRLKRGLYDAKVRKWARMSR
ncbi:MAG: peptide deformylase [Deltaproteobacteria bacterium]|jgi:peptide deformylase|nr:peptide deformylase [Deltaproteobacteria bacterium]